MYSMDRVIVVVLYVGVFVVYICNLEDDLLLIKKWIEKSIFVRRRMGKRYFFYFFFASLLLCVAIYFCWVRI